MVRALTLAVVTITLLYLHRELGAVAWPRHQRAGRQQDARRGCHQLAFGNGAGVLTALAITMRLR